MSAAVIGGVGVFDIALILEPSRSPKYQSNKGNQFWTGHDNNLEIRLWRF
jgi:hypothetical protein